MEDTAAYRLPTDKEIAAVAAELNFGFPDAYIAFLKSGGKVAGAIYEPALVLPGIGRLYLVNIAREAWTEHKISREWLPFIEDNGNYFLVATSGEVRYLSHDGASTERWLTFADWFQKCCIERS